MDLEAARPTKAKKYILSPSFRRTSALGFLSLGAIYGDIATSPLYVFSSIITDVPSRESVYGAASCIFWIFVIEVVFKYCLIVLYFGPNNNEGGQVAIYAKIAQHLKIGPQSIQSSQTSDLLSLTRSGNQNSDFNPSRNEAFNDLHSAKRWFDKFKIENGRYNKTLVEKYLSKFILGCCFIGCSLVISDGLLTPTTSVLSSIAGIAIPVPSLADKVMPISCAVLIVLFTIQRFGSAKISLFFAPVIFVWLILLLFCGIYNIQKYEAGIFAAISPHYAIKYIHTNGIKKLGGVMLAITGCEAMFADIGHFSRLSIQLTLTCFVFPCLAIHYFGQAAYLLKYPQNISNVFYLSIPFKNGGAFYWVIFVLATLATVIASQALILGVFSILRQMIHLDCFPSFKVTHTSSKHFGQVYIPAINFILMVAVILTTVGFRNSNNVTAAYGLGISLDFLVTTCLITICLLYVYKVPLFVALLFFLPFGAVDMLLIIANVQKIPEGAWFPIVVTFVMFCFILYWRWCRSLQINEQYRNRIRLNSLFSSISLKDKSDKVNQELEDNDNIAINKTINFDSDIVDLSEKLWLPTNKNTAAPTDESDAFIDPLYKVKYSSKISYPFVRYRGLGIMYTDTTYNLNSIATVPKAFGKILTCFPSLPTKFVFLSIRIISEPYVKYSDHIVIEKIKSAGETNGFYRCVANFGFMDKIRMTNLTIKAITNAIGNEDLDEEVRMFGETSEHNGKENVCDMKDDFLVESRVIHFVDKSVIRVKYPSDAKKINMKNFVVNKMNLSWLLFRYNIKKFLVQQIYASISGMFSGLENIIDDRQNEVLFIGSKAYI